MIAPIEALASIPDELDAEACRAAAVRRHHHLQRAAQCGARAGDSWPFKASAGSAISACNSPAAWVSIPLPSPAGKDKEKLARDLGAHRYIDSERKTSPRR